MDISEGFGPLTSEIIGKSNRINWPIDLRYRQAYDFVQMDDVWVQKNLSIVGLRLKRDLSGIETLNLEEVQDKKNIATTRSFDVMVGKFDDLNQRVINFAAIVGRN